MRQENDWAESERRTTNPDIFIDHGVRGIHLIFLRILKPVRVAASLSVDDPSRISEACAGHDGRNNSLMLAKNNVVFVSNLSLDSERAYEDL